MSLRQTMSNESTVFPIIRNFDAWKVIDIPNVSVKSLKSLKQLDKYGISSCSFLCTKTCHNELDTLKSNLLDNEPQGIKIKLYHTIASHLWYNHSYDQIT